MLSSEVRINPDVFDLTRFEPDAFSIEWLQALKKSRKISCDQSKLACFVIPKEYCSVFPFIDKNEVAAIILSDRVSFVGDMVNGILLLAALSRLPAIALVVKWSLCRAS